MGDKDDWFEEQSLGRIAVVDWRGWLCTLALMVLCFVGTGVESACRPDHPILEIVLLVPLGVLLLGLAWFMSTRTRRSGGGRG
ncbi:hypothetical protein [Lichenifustis flavocetrariae]|uniref:Uncharacterized protein n=1 Tax=Lichenifustis flavocetrariae TaxID=2949735 RepID=A0AA42CM36_9HYPH|nr:hypothetical protein [Lichenifustis flavocetrariae]MCW6507955.1 hypothetical protein [Lichenifustis flavocetrariae]